MKRVGNLWEPILERDNLRLAFHKAMKGKRDREQTRLFGMDLDRNLEEMAAQLRDGTFPVGRVHQFVIHDPKERIITAPCFAERVMHHAVMNLCEPHFDRWLIPDTYACRKGKGRLRALARAQGYCRRYAWFLKMDVRKFFDSVPHERLLSLLAAKIKDKPLLGLFSRIVQSYRSVAGLPIGSLTSQHLANFYLGGLDRLAKDTLRLPGCVRYMDDVLMWSDDKPALVAALDESRRWLRQERGLELKAEPYLNRTARGVDFLGCRLHRRHMTLNRASRVRFRRKLVGLEREYAEGWIDEATLQARGTALVAFARTAGLSSCRFRANVLSDLAGSGPRARSG